MAKIHRYKRAGDPKLRAKQKLEYRLAIGGHLMAGGTARWRTYASGMWDPTKATVAELEAAAKDLQREVNRRYDTLYSRPDYQTKPFKDLVKSGGKLSLSHMPGETTQQRRGQLMREISRGIRFLQAKTSSVSGVRQYVMDTIEGMARAAHISFDEAKKIVEKVGFKRMTQFIEEARKRSYLVYMKAGSPVFIDIIMSVVNEYSDKEDAITIADRINQKLKQWAANNP